MLVFSPTYITNMHFIFCLYQYTASPKFRKVFTNIFHHHPYSPHYASVTTYDYFRPANRCGDICDNFGPSMDRLDTQHWVCYKFFCSFYFHDSCYDSSTSLLPSYGSQSYKKVFIIYLNIMIPIKII